MFLLAVSMDVLSAEESVNFTLEQSTKAHRWSRVIAVLFL